MLSEESAEFAQLLVRHRLAAGLTQDELARRAGLSRRGISDLERGARRSPYPATVRQLADALALADADRTTLLALSRGSRAQDRPPTSAEHAALVGRSTEMALLRSALQRASVGAGQTVLLGGEAGVGKTRLIRAARREALARGLRVLEGHCFESDRALAYGPISDLLHSWLNEREVQGWLSDIGADIVAAVVQLVPSCATLLPSTSPLEPLDPEQDRLRLFHLLTRMFGALCNRGPVLLIVEDLHWSDESSLAFLLHLARRVPGLPMLVLLSFRGEDMPSSLNQILLEFRRRKLAVERVVAPLNRVDFDALVAGIVPAGCELRPELLDTVYELTDGNPYFVEEILGAVCASTRGGLTAGSASQVRIPRTVQDAVHRRVERLSPEAREVLELAAVAGRRFDFALLAALSGQTEHDLVQIVRDLIDAQLVIEEAVDQFAFRHALTREAVVSRLLGRERRELHRRVAEVLDQRSSSNLTDAQVAELAYHFYHAAVWEPALVYTHRAGDRAMAAQAPAAAADAYTWALQASAQIGGNGTAELLRARGRAYEMLGDFEPAKADLEAALDRARASTDVTQWQALIDLGFLWAGRDLERSGAYYRQALGLAQASGDSAALAHSINRLANWHLNQEQVAQARAAHAEALDIFDRIQDSRGLAETLDLLGMTEYISGDLIAAATYYRRAVGLFRERGDRRGLAGASQHLMACAGSLPSDALVAEPMPDREARAAGELALRLAREMNWQAGEADASVLLGYYLRRRGEYVSAFAHARTALDVAEDIEHMPWMTSAHSLLGLLHLDLFALDDARAHLERAFQLARASGSGVWVRAAGAFLALGYIAQRELADASDLLDEVMGSGSGIETIGQRNGWLARAELALARHEPATALAILDYVLANTPHASPDTPVPGVEYLRARAFAALLQLNEAELSAQRAKDAAAASGLRPLQWRIHALRGALHMSWQHPRKAEREFAAARRLVDELSAGVADDALRATFRARAARRLRVHPLRR